MNEAADYPRTLDATPTAKSRGTDAGGYGYAFLASAGYLPDPSRAEATYLPGHDLEYLASTDGLVRVGYFEFPLASVPTETPRLIVRALARRTRLQYFWFFDPGTREVRAFRTSRRPARFRYVPAAHTEHKRDALERARSDLDAVFDGTAVVDRLADDLRTHRAALAEAVTGGRDSGTVPTDRVRRTVAGRLIERVLVCYLLLERGLVAPVDGGTATVPAAPRLVLERLFRDGDDIGAILRTIVASLSSGPDTVTVSDSFRLRVPTLGWTPFRTALETTERGVDDRETDASGRTEAIDESALVVEGYDWTELLAVLGEYEWRPGGIQRDVDTADHAGSVMNAGRGDHRGRITPAVLDDLYDRGTLGPTEREGTGRDDGPDGRDDSPTDERESTGTPTSPADEVGAYYTGTELTYFTVRRALWAALYDRIESDCKTGVAPSAIRIDDLPSPNRERRNCLEHDRRDGFDELYERYGDDREVLAYVDSKLRDLTVCDPAAGTGAFVLAAANVLFEWRSMCRPDADAAEIGCGIARSVFGVDLRDDAVERCRRRLWLRLVSLCPVTADRRDSYTTGCSGVTLPNLTGTVRSGNSLLGFVDPPSGRDHREPTDSRPLEERLREYGHRLRRSYSETGPDRTTRRPLEERRAELKRVLDRRYATARCERADGSPLRVDDRVRTAADARRSLEDGRERNDRGGSRGTDGSGGSPTLVVEVPEGIPAPAETGLEAIGFTTYTYRARLEQPSNELDSAALGAVFDRLETSVADPEGWSVLVEREYAGRDFRADGLDALHWPLAFPRPVLEDGGFDVVVSNPPYGADVAPEAEPIVRSETNYECQGARDTCEWFLERTLQLACDRGVVANVVPKTVAFYRSWAAIRTKLLANTSLEHVFDVGLGFDDVDLETIVIVGRLVDSDDGHTARAAAPATVHRSRDPRRADENAPVHLGRVDQRFMRDAETIAFRPIDDAQREVLSRIRSTDRRLDDVISAAEPTRQLYIPDSEKERLEPGPDPYIDRVPWVRPYHLTGVRYLDLGAYRDAVRRYAVPRVMLKVLRGSRLRAWIDPTGAVVGTEKLVSAPLEAHTQAEIAFIYAVLNHPFASYYLQKVVFSETTETARVMDGHYSASIPVPDPDPTTTAAVAQLVWTVTLATQLAHDRAGGGTLEPSIETVTNALHALLAGVYLEDERTRSRWVARLDRSWPDERTVRSLFTAFYAERFATRRGRPDAYWTDIRDLLESTRAVTATWETTRLLDGHAMNTVMDVLE
ncbi:Eco57I restriction-modification methylase domain-containing protein [Halopiger djelfimassiliensis]|uniref:Eco57I restriction-modification methylase domain-containing protein n=1 Tax=Halopiger djelfimassiliensis TaxID=1293047 RepID=UPI000677B2BC|nr:hypothetical protein [Halopiger djelfimassiliensis]